MLAMPMLTVDITGSSDQPCTLRRMVSATIIASAPAVVRQQHREFLAAIARRAVAGAVTESEMQMAIPTSTWSPAWWP